jgi:hypothetical protein
MTADEAADMIYGGFRRAILTGEVAHVQPFGGSSIAFFVYAKPLTIVDTPTGKVVQERPDVVIYIKDNAGVPECLIDPDPSGSSSVPIKVYAPTSVVQKVLGILERRSGD